VIAFALLDLVPGGFNFVLLTSFCIALIGVGLITLLVDKPQTAAAEPGQPAPSIRLSLGLWMEPAFRTITLAGGVLALMTASDAFIYLVVQKNTGCSTTAFPLFALITAAAYLLLAVPLGKLADAWGRRKVFLGGFVPVLVAYVILLTPGLGKYAQFASVGLLGAYYAATNGVLAAVASSALAPNLRTSGLAFLNTVLGVCKFVSSLLFGLLWTTGGMKTPILVFTLGLVAAFAVSGWILNDNKIKWSDCKGCFGCKRCGKRY